MPTEVPVRVYRRSALEAISCPKRFFEIYERPDPIEDSSDEALRGQGFHDVAKRYIQRLANLRLTTDAEELHIALQETIVALRIPAHLVKEIEALAERWALTFALDLDSYLLSEEPQVLEGAGMQWTPDLVYARGEELEQVDWKTHWAGISDRDVKDQFQAQAYVWAAAQKWPGFDSYRFTFTYPRLGYSATAVWSQSEVDELDIIVKSRIHVIDACREAGEWKATPGSMCIYCRLDCPVKDHGSLDVSRVKNAEEAAAIAGELMVFDKAATARRNALKGWCEQHGPVVCNEVEWGYSNSDVTTFPANGVLDVLDSHGIANREFTITKSALRKYLATKQFAHVASDLWGVAVQKHRSVFGSRIKREKV
jgi:hypothetical protein|tara:strand:- start:29846 stop:30949 length:1104 start_codon:yes stop_codon:yes gene_type:complete